MKVWLLRPNPNCPDGRDVWQRYDMIHGHVVVAADEAEARRLAQEAGIRCGGLGTRPRDDDEKNAWLDPKMSLCEELPGEGGPRAVLYDGQAA